MKPESLKVSEYAKLHSKSTATVREHVRAGRIPAEKVGGFWRIKKDTPYPAPIRYTDISGRQFGRLTAMRPTEKRDSKGSVLWECACSCGNPAPAYVSARNLCGGAVTSCGCKKTEAGKKTHIMASAVAKKSPKAGRFETNVNAKEWELISPDGREFRCTNLLHWAREHTELFGFMPGDDSARKIAHGFTNIAHRPDVRRYKGWTLSAIPQKPEKT